MENRQCQSFAEAFDGIRAKLLQNMSVTPFLVNYLQDKELLTRYHAEQIMSKSTEHDRVDKLLGILERRDDKLFPEFLAALTADNQGHVVRDFFSQSVPQFDSRSSVGNPNNDVNVFLAPSAVDVTVTYDNNYRFFDAMVLYDTENDVIREWVSTHLLPRMHAERDPPYRLTDVDQTPKGVWIEWICETLKNSKRKIFVLDNSGVDTYTMMALREVMHKPYDVLFVLFPDFDAERSLSATTDSYNESLRFYLRQESCLEIDDIVFWKKLFQFMQQASDNSILKRFRAFLFKHKLISS